MPLAGYGNVNQRMSTNVLSKLYASCLALTDGEGNTVLLITMDLINAAATVTNPARELIEKAIGIPGNRVMVTASHTHSGPNMTSTTPQMKAYYTQVSEKLCKIAQEAIADQLPAQLYTGSIETDRMNFIRHCTYVDSDGNTKYFGNNFGDHVFNDTSTYATGVDLTMHLVKFTREGGKDIVLANWRAHPTLTGGTKKTDISAVYVGAFRDYLEEQTGRHAIYFQGVAGNVNASSYFKEDMRTKDYKTHGMILAAFAVKGLKENMNPAEPGQICVSSKQFVGTVNHATDRLVERAKEVRSVWVKTNNKAQANAVGLPYGIRSPYHASAIITRAGLGDYLTLELNVITIGNALAITTAPTNCLMPILRSWKRIRLMPPL